MSKIYICPTPIGNLDDITLRTIKVFEKVDIIAAEDTRRTIKLLNYYDIKKPLTSYHEHNIRTKGPELIEKINQGKSIALVSDAGMPGISDPGEDLIKLAIESNIDIVALPGATASITALILSGLSTEKFIFEGFLSSKKQDKLKELKKISNNIYTSILYESPYRLIETLELIDEVFGDRKISISRELTKKYEETLRGTAKELLGNFDKNNIKGEFVIVIEGKEIVEEETNIEDIEEILRDMILNDGMRKSDAVKKVSRIYEIPRNLVYDLSLKI